MDVRLALPARAHAALLAQIAADTELLQALHVMDYSLLLGLHFPRWGAAWFPPHSAPVRGPPLHALRRALPRRCRSQSGVRHALAAAAAEPRPCSQQTL